MINKNLNTNKKIIDWEKWEQENEREWIKETLKNTKSGSISFLEDQGKYKSREEQFHAHWETYLSSNEYWKNWREKINNFETEKEVNFYTDRLFEFIDFVEKYTRKDMNCYCSSVIEGAQQWDPINTPKMIEQELKRLENISEEDFKKEDKTAGVEWKELSAEEMLNDPWFSKQIDNLFGSENGNKNQEPPRKNNEEPQTTIDKRQRDYKKFQASDNKDIDASKILGIIGIIIILVITSAVVMKKKLSRKVRK